MATNNKRNLNYVVNTKFKGDKSDLDKTLKELRQQLNEISNINVVVDNQSLKDGVQAAKDLQKYLDMSMDTSTGNLDLSKFSQTLRQAGTDVNTLSAKLLAVGDQGTDAFLNFAQAVSQAQIPMRRTNALLSEMWATMKNTVRWQLTSSMLHGFMGAMQQAIGYAKDLDRSLNQIRIVTGKSGDDMAKFAVEANKAAQALSTTTTDYTDASLIYYQQGLSDSEVKARTDITIKAANAAGSSAEEMSEYLTAIWNSYQVGSKDLERFVDVIAKLGAETATSLEEIATGMQKVAATGNAVGVEYEQLASILATVSSVTRESPETSGTAFKTIFARMGDLKLGQGEDGETLGTVSSQLAQIGVNILDVNGDLRDMGDVIEELGNKWQDMSSATQVAVAQAVAGKRQYTQLIALFDNWDMYLNNMAIASGAEGQLENMASIYEESWAAANKRLKASFEEMYGSLIDSDVIIGLTDALAEIVKGVDNVIDSFGGLQGVIATVGGLLATKFAKQASDGIKQFGQNLRVTFGMAQKDMEAIQNDVILTMKNMLNREDMTSGDKIQIESMSKLIAATQEYQKIKLNLNDTEKYYGDIILDNSKKIEAEIKKESELLDKRNAARNLAIVQAKGNLYGIIDQAAKAKDENGKSSFLYLNKAEQKEQAKNSIASSLIQYSQAVGQTTGILKELEQTQIQLSNETNDTTEVIKFGTQEYTNYANKIEELVGKLPQVVQENNSVKQSIEQLKNGVLPLESAIEQIFQSVTDSSGGMELFEQILEGKVSPALKNFIISAPDAQKVINAITKAAQEAGVSEENLAKLTDQLKSSLDGLPNSQNRVVSGGERLVSVTGALTSTYGLYNSIINITNTLQDENATGTEKLMSIVGSASGIIMNVTNVVKGLSVALGISKIAALGLGAVIVGVVAAITVLYKQEQQGVKLHAESAERQLEEAKASQQLKESIDDLSESVSGLVNEYNELSNSHQDTSETIDNLNDKIPELIEGYKNYAQAAKAAGVEIDGFSEKLELLENAYKRGIITGNFSEAEELQKQIEAEIDYSSAEVARKGSQSAAKRIAVTTQEQGDLRAYGTGSEVQIRFDANVKDIELLKDFYTFEDDKIVSVTFDTEKNPEKFVEEYEKAQEAAKKLEDSLSLEDLNRSAAYKDINDFLNKNKEAYEDLSEQIKIFNNTAANSLAKSSGLLEATNYAEFNKAKEEFKKQAKELYQLDKDQTEQLLEQASAVTQVGKAYLVAEKSAKAFNLQGQEDQLTEILSQWDEKDLELALTIIPEEPNEMTFAEFSSKMVDGIFNRVQTDLQTKSAQLTTVLNNAIEEGNFDQAIDFLGSDEEFQAFLVGREKGVKNFSDFVKASYAEQSSAITEYYTMIQDNALESLKAQESYYEQEVSQLRQMIEMRKAYDEANTHNAKDQIAKQFEDTFGIDIKINNLDNLYSQLDQVNDKLEEVTNKKREINFDWSEADLIENQYDKIAEFAEEVNNNTQQVGKNYQFTRDQIREWAKVYPELFAQADDVTGDIIELDKNYVDSYIAGQKEAMDASTEKTIQVLDAERTELKGKIKSLDKQIEAIRDYNIMDLSDSEITASNKAKIQENLVKYFLELGYEEQEANRKALAQMGLNTQEWEDIVAESAQDAANSLGNAGGSGASGFLTGLKNGMGAFIQKVKEVGFLEAVGSITVNGYIPTVAPSVKTSISDSNDARINRLMADPFTSGYDPNAKFNTDFTDPSKYVLSAVYKAREDLAEYLSLEKDDYQAQYDDLTNEINYLRAALNGNLKEWNKASGGKGSSGSRSQRDIEDLDGILERYHQITREITLQERELNKLSTIKDRAYGKDKLKALDNEAKSLEILRKDNEDLKKAAEAYRDMDRVRMEALNPNVKLNSLGEIVNYDQLQEQYEDELKRAANKYNASAQTDADKKAMEDAKQLYEDRMKSIEKYENSLDKAAEAAQELFDIENRLADNKLEKITYEVEYKINISEDSKKLIDYELNKIADESFTIPEQVFYKTGAVEEVMTQSELIAQGIAKINADIAEQGGKATDAQIQQLRNYRDQLLSNNEALQEYNKTIRESLVKGLEEVNNKLDKQSAKFATYTNMLNHMKDIAELTGQTLGKNILGNAISNAAYNNAFNSIESSIAEFQTTQEAYEHAKNMLAQLQRTRTIEDDADIKYWKDTLLEMENALVESQNNMLSSWTTAIKAAADRYETEIDSIVQTLEESLSPFRTLDNFQDLFDKRNTLNEQYLSDLEKEYQLNKLNRNILASIADTSSLAAKEKLRDLANEIAEAQKNEAEMSKYDLDILQAKYDLRLAEIAMEEAQNNKSQMRLTRDASGNWTYAYTADQSKIDDASQKYDDSLRKLQKVSEDYIDDLSGDIIKNEKSLRDYIASIDKNMYRTDKEYMDKVKEQYNYYLERDKYLRGEFDKALEDLGIKYSDTTLGAVENMGSMTNAHENFVKSADKAFNDAIKASEKYVESTNAVKNKLEPIFGDMEGQLANISNKSNELGNTVKELVPDMIDYLNKIYTNTSEWSNNMVNRIKPVIEAYEELARATNNAINNTEIMNASNAQQTPHTDYSAQMSKVLEANNDWQQALQSPVMADLILKREQKIQEQGGLNGSKETWKYLVDEIISNLTQKGINVTPALSGYIQKFVQNIVKGIVGYATGGYTGEWGNDGRLAILHQKELVLNQDDTRNMLGAVNILRQMAGSIGDQLASNASLAAYNAGHSLSNVPIGLSGGSAGVVQQVVSIDATFPDVKSAYEIELALNNIVNDAAQYASKKKLD